jgi:hypothetical protein
MICRNVIQAQDNKVGTYLCSFVTEIILLTFPSYSLKLLCNTLDFLVVTWAVTISVSISLQLLRQFRN